MRIDGRIRWTPERKALLRTMWTDWASPAAIAEALGCDFTALAVRRSVERLGLKRGRRPKPETAPAPTKRPAADNFEHAFIVAKRATARVPMAHLARMLGKSETDLRLRYGR